MPAVSENSGARFDLGMLGLRLIVNQGPSLLRLRTRVSEDLGVSRGTLSSAVGLLLAVFAVFVPVMGSLIDRYSVRTVLMPMIVLVALATASLSLLRASPFILYPLFALQGLFATCQVPIGYAKVITASFDRERGLALGIAVAGAGLGVALVPQLVSLPDRAAMAGAPPMWGSAPASC